MTVVTQNEEKTLGYWAALAIKKHFEKVLKHEEDVLADRDPEALHQMRVGTRRLRSAIAGFAPALDLSKSFQEKKIGKIARTLGALRDLDVLGEALQNQYKPVLPSKEQHYLDTALTHLHKQRRQALEEVKDTLEGDRYHSMKRAVKKWLKQPSYQEIAQMPIQEVLPDLLLPEVSNLLLHPGWLVGTEVKEGEIHVLQELEPETVAQKLGEQGHYLHSLRKATKRIRYQMEVFSNFYGYTYKSYLEDIKNIQAILGQIQDSFVLTEFLDRVLDSEIKKLPTLTEELAQKNHQAWQEWQSLQERYLTSETRKGLHLAILQPTFEQDGNESSKIKLKLENDG